MSKKMSKNLIDINVASSFFDLSRMSSLKLSKNVGVHIEVIYRRADTLCERLDHKILYVLDLRHVTKALTPIIYFEKSFLIGRWIEKWFQYLLIVHATLNQSEKFFNKNYFLKNRTKFSTCFWKKSLRFFLYV